MPQKSLHYELDFFFDLTRQIAVKRYTHKKFWNVVLHSFTSWIISWCGFYLLACFLPSLLLKVNLVFVLILCIAQDPYLGMMSLPGYMVVFYHAMYLTALSILQTLSLLMLVVLFQIFVGQKWIENNEPFSGPIKSESTSFAIFDFFNDIFVAPFHYMVTLLMRLDFREDLRWRSDTELRKIMTKLQPIP